MRNIFRVIALGLAFFAASRSLASDVRHLEDATLRGVFFIDKNEGWIVGDEGVILHTLNGGKRWERQTTATRASLRSVHFLTSEVGWAVGREELPGGMGSVGVVLFTSDGGLEWKRQLPNSLPGLNHVRFTDPRTGFMLGDGSDQFPSGAFRTNDSGKSWEPIPGPRTTAWLAGDFYDGRIGILAGAYSRLATFRAGKTTQAEHADSLSGRDITALQILGKKTIAVGQGGLVLTSASGGSAWDFAKTNLSTDLLANLDFHALSAVKEKVWVVGRPGSIILASPDAGATWTLHKTGQSLPLHGIHFIDEKTGWTVGDAGTILHTADAGKTWVIQHQAGQRAAAITIHSLNKNAPVDTVASLGAADGNLTTSLRITAPDSSMIAWGRDKDSRRYVAALRRAGALTGETLWHFPMPQHLEACDKATILAHWNQLHARRAEEELIRQLVLTLRIWRPSVIVTEHPESKTALSSLLGEAVQEAVRRAADAKAFPEQIDELGLKAWKVECVFGINDNSSNRNKVEQAVHDNEDAKPHLQTTIRDFVGAAQSILSEGPKRLPAQRTYDRLYPATKTPVARNMMAGIATKVGESRRDMPTTGVTDVKLLQALSARRSVMEVAENLEDPARTLSLLPIALDKLPDEHAPQAAFAIAGRYAERGEWYFAQEIYLYLVDRFPAHPLSSQAYRWLIRLNSSSEARRRHELKHFAVADPISVVRKDGLTLPKEKILRVGHVELASEASILQQSQVRDWNKGGTELMKRLAGYGPVYRFDPATQFCLQSAKRALGDVGAANTALDQLSKVIPAGPWHDAARAELWLTQGGAAAPRGLARARYTEARPFLDGKFDDACWQDVKWLTLANAVGESVKDHATEAMFAFDQEFLYIAVRCSHPAGKHAPLVKSPRTPTKNDPRRDADLSAHDRVSILLDLDRDRATYYQFEVDQRGCYRDSCWHDNGWNPRWFFAVHSTEAGWQFEAAIPLGELTGDRLQQNTAWTFNIVRTMPGRGVQSWSQPADVEPRPEGMSLLLFQTPNAKSMPKEP